jgi:hypothetical protein
MDAHRNMADRSKRRPRRGRVLLWIALAIPSAIGLFFLGLVVAGLVQAARLGCGTRQDWTEANYIPCSDIDEANPIFFVMGVGWLLPLIITLLVLGAVRLAKTPQS